MHETRRDQGRSPQFKSGADSETPEAPQPTFIESLCLPVAVLESLTRGDFVYCKRKGGALDSNAYQLCVVDHKDVSTTDYCTVSQAGVTHVSDAR